MAALCQSRDLSACQLFVKDFLISQLNGKEIFDIWNPRDPYEYLIKLLKTDLEPRLCNQSATNTILANYQVGLYDKQKLMGIGEH